MIQLMTCLVLIKISPIVTELLIRGTKLNTFSLHKSYFAVPKYIRLNSIHYFIMKTTSKMRASTNRI